MANSAQLEKGLWKTQSCRTALGMAEQSELLGSQKTTTLETVADHCKLLTGDGDQVASAHTTSRKSARCCEHQLYVHSR